MTNHCIIFVSVIFILSCLDFKIIFSLPLRKVCSNCFLEDDLYNQLKFEKIIILSQWDYGTLES